MDDEIGYLAQIYSYKKLPNEVCDKSEGIDHPKVQVGYLCRIASEDQELIKKMRSSIQGMITNIQKSLGKLLARTTAQAKLKRMKRTLTRSTRIIYTTEK